MESLRRSHITDLVMAALGIWQGGDMETGIAEIRGIFHGFGVALGRGFEDTDALCQEFCVAVAANDGPGVTDVVQEFVGRLLADRLN